MTEDEAKKILDWLCMRWAKNIQHLYKTRNAMNITVKMSGERWIVSDYNALELVCEVKLVFEVVVFDEHERAKNKFNFNSRLIYEVDQQRLEILKVKSRSKSQFADFLEYAFNKHDIFVEGWEVHGVNFIDAGESLEEIKVKMDLEDV